MVLSSLRTEPKSIISNTFGEVSATPAVVAALAFLVFAGSGRLGMLGVVDAAGSGRLGMLGVVDVAEGGYSFSEPLSCRAPVRILLRLALA